jgi:HK97 family phage portal protein
MPPPGGTRTPISYFWGAPGPLSGGGEQTARFAEVFQPDAGIFSPNYPLVPTEAERLRVWDYPVGYNYTYTPRSFEPVGFAEMEALAYNHDITRLAIETRKDQLEKLEWKIKSRDEKNPLPDAEERVAQLTDFWASPDGEQPFATWLRETMESVLVTDAASFEVRKNRGGEVIGIDNVDGKTIKVLIDHTGRRPVAPAPAWEQVIHGRPWRLLTTEEFIYAPRNVRPGHVYGFSPVEQILTTINIALRRQTAQLQWFTESNIPRGLLNAPDGWSTQQIRQFQEWFDSVLAGNMAERQKALVAPWGMKYQAFKDPPLKDEMDEWFARVVCYAFSLPPDAFVRQRNRATAETARQSALEEGLSPLMGWVKRLADGIIQNRQGHKDLEFSWQEIHETDPQVQADVTDKYVRAGTYSINEQREILGKDKIQDGDEHLVYTAAGPVKLADIVNPPPPPPATTVGEPAAADGPAASKDSDVGHDGLPVAEESTKPDGTREVGKSATGTFRTSIAVARRTNAQREADAAIRDAVAAEAWSLLRGAGASRRGAVDARLT